VKVHGPSVAIGFFSALVIGISAKRLRPVAIEIGALAMEIANMARATIELRREDIEDFFFDVQHRSTQRAQERRTERMRQRETGKPSTASKA
jgi:hypothetical protein